MLYGHYLFNVFFPSPPPNGKLHEGSGEGFDLEWYSFLPRYYKPWKTSWLSGWELFPSSSALKGIWDSVTSAFTVYLWASMHSGRAGLADLASWWLIVLQHDRLEACGGTPVMVAANLRGIPGGASSLTISHSFGCVGRWEETGDWCCWWGFVCLTKCQTLFEFHQFSY